MRAYSEDLRHMIVKAVERGMSKARAARLFDVSLSSVKRYARITREGGSLKSPGRPPKIDKKARNLLEEDVKCRPALGFFEHCGYRIASQPLRGIM
jgi:transposase